MTCYFDSFPTSFGEFTIAVNDAGAVTATAFGGQKALIARLGACSPINDRHRTTLAREQALEYFAGRRRKFDLPLAASGTEFQHKVWAALGRIPFGTTRSYGEIADALGKPGAARAVGRANASNPICLIVPCHRVIGASGALTGFAFGEKLKARLLDHERAVAAISRAA